MKAFRRNLTDAELTKTAALPAAASSNITTGTLDIKGTNSPGYAYEGAELSLIVPALPATIVPANKTVTASVEVSNDSAFAQFTTIMGSTATGDATNGGTQEFEARASMPLDYRYARGKVAFGADTTTGAAYSCTFALIF